MKKNIILFMAVLLVGSVSAFNITMFNDSTTAGNFTYTTGLESPTKTLNLPMNARVNNAYLYLTGFVSSNVTSLRKDWTFTATMFTGANITMNPLLYFDFQKASDGSFSSYGYVNNNGLGFYNANWTVTNPGFNHVLTYKILRQYGNASIYCRNKGTGNGVLIFSDVATGDILNGSVAIPPECLSGSTDLETSTWLESNGCCSSGLLFEEQLITGSFPGNVTVNFNNQSTVFNYGAGNGSVLNHTVLANITGGFNISPITLWNFSFLSNTSGILEFKDLFVEYANSFNVYMYDEGTGALILDNLTMELYQGESLNSYWTTNGTIQLIDNFNGDYTVSVYNNNYSRRIYAVSFSGGESKSLNVYLANLTNEVTFSLFDELTTEPIEGAIFAMARIINGSWQTVTSQFTDVTGKVKFSFASNVRYRFTVSKAGYVTKVFYLDPILFTSYNVRMARTTGGIGGSDYAGVSIFFEPKTFYDGVENNVSFNFYSPDGYLTAYGLSLTYPGGSNSYSGSNANGETFDFSINISGANLTDMVTYDFYYITNATGRRDFTLSYGIIQENISRGTFYYNKGETYGLGAFERVLIAVIASLIVAGFVSVFAGYLPGMLAGVFILGLFSYMGFVSWWANIISMLTAFIIMSGRSAE